jgi:hypothetical protein
MLKLYKGELSSIQNSTFFVRAAQRISKASYLKVSSGNSLNKRHKLAKWLVYLVDSCSQGTNFLSILHRFHICFKFHSIWQLHCTTYTTFSPNACIRMMWRKIILRKLAIRKVAEILDCFKHECLYKKRLQKLYFIAVHYMVG